MAKKSLAVDGYGLTTDFERQIAALCAHRPGFLGALGNFDTGRIDHPASKLVIRLCLAIQHDHGKGPTSPVTVVQRARRWNEEGSLSGTELEMVQDFVMEEAGAAYDENEVMSELAPILRRAIQSEAVTAGMDAYRTRSDFEKVKKKIAEAERVGIVDVSVGSMLGMHSFDDIEALGAMERLPTGIPELDILIEGGVPRGCMMVWVASTSGGKSQTLVHTTAHALRMRKVVCVATLELPPPKWQARVMANLTGVPSNMILSGEGRRRAEDILAQMMPDLGRMVIKGFPAQATTVQDIADWIDNTEQKLGEKVEVVELDYGDKLASHNKAENGSNSTYHAMNSVYEGLRLQIAEKPGRYLHTASQSKSRVSNERTKRIEAEDVSDSYNKSRVTDMMVSLVIQKDCEPKMVTYFVAKHRYGQDGVSTSPIPVDLECSRMSPLVDL